MKVISLLSMKGGTAKTTSAVNLAAGLALAGYKTLLIDADAQGNATSYFSKEQDYLSTLLDYSDLPYREAMAKTLKLTQEFKKDTYDVLMDPACIKEAIYPTSILNLYLVPSQSHHLIVADKNITLDTKRPQQTRFKKALREVRKEFDYVVIDNAPTSNSVTINSLVASNLIIIPVKPGGDEIEGLASTIEDIETIKDNFDIEVDFKVLLTMFHSPKEAEQGFIFNRKMESKEYEILYQLFKDKLFNSIIRYQDGIITKSSINKELLITSNSKVAQDYTNLVKEIMKVGEDDE